MTPRVGIIGVGHFAGYLIAGFENAGEMTALRLFSRTRERAERVAAGHAIAEVFNSPQEAIDGATVIVVATRPADVEAALAGLTFSKDQVVVSVAAGVTLDRLQRLTGEATAVRALPVACAAINKSPILLMPENAAARAVLEQLGRVYALRTEKQFDAGTALVGAFYAMIFPLMDHLATWTAAQGLDDQLARSLVVETISGASAMAEHARNVPFQEIWSSLAVPGGISERGMDALEGAGGLAAWSSALDAVVRKLRGDG
ncbi:pyrroline-5-carboxylate reductase [Mesorhizobium soli]|uniref:pyrroline-5-carboxylate reductase family protein n=1 Tax=Pseudaminobacter soli (ex Li et al. 2025) TaxID=1295366 RepID=UPI0024761463|nr:pyrroline-5-carboxylate reductase dimerization domain-containing protein [Mesorhizobium soli]MDH6234620.1 pyrroline-5-carboxylate reductase [Mesorhizobium soli]